MVSGRESRVEGGERDRRGDEVCETEVKTQKTWGIRGRVGPRKRKRQGGRPLRPRDESIGEESSRSISSVDTDGLGGGIKLKDGSEIVIDYKES